MKPVCCGEIVCADGEFLYRKGSRADPAGIDVSRCRRSSYIGCSGIIFCLCLFAVAFSIFGLRPLLRYRKAGSVHWRVIAAKDFRFFLVS